MVYRMWSEAETAELLKLMETHGRDFKTIGRLMDRSWRSCEHRWRWLNMTDEQKKRRNEAEALRKAKSGERCTGIKQKGVDAVRPVVASLDLLEERARRLSVPRTITGIICGDPPPGYSALDRMRRGEKDPIYIDKRLEQFRRQPTLAGTPA
jgi:hypothetical protein